MKYFLLILILWMNTVTSQPVNEKGISLETKDIIFRNKKKVTWKFYDDYGLLTTEGEEAADYIDITYYQNGRWMDRIKTYISRKKEEHLAPKNKPFPIPPYSVFNFDFKKWENGYFHKGRKEGVWKLWWPEGKPAGMIEYKNGVYNGKIKILYENGKLAEEGFFIAGKKEGVFKTYYQSGSIMEKIPYLNGLTHGTYILYNEAGEEMIRYDLYKGNVSK